MKKTYINPEMEIIKIASKTQMLAGSVIEHQSGDAITPGMGRDDEFDW